jgi:hypothetical protein
VKILKEPRERAPQSHTVTRSCYSNRGFNSSAVLRLWMVVSRSRARLACPPPSPTKPWRADFPSPASTARPIWMETLDARFHPHFFSSTMPAFAQLVFIYISDDVLPDAHAAQPSVYWCLPSCSRPGRHQSRCQSNLNVVRRSTGCSSSSRQQDPFFFLSCRCRSVLCSIKCSTAVCPCPLPCPGCHVRVIKRKCPLLWTGLAGWSAESSSSASSSRKQTNQPYHSGFPSPPIHSGLTFQVPFQPGSDWSNPSSCRRAVRWRPPFAVLESAQTATSSGRDTACER